eukprot:UN09238
MKIEEKVRPIISQNRQFGEAGQKVTSTDLRKVRAMRIRSEIEIYKSFSHLLAGLLKNFASERNGECGSAM